MSQVNNNSSVSNVNFSQVTGARSPQLALAMLMLELAETNKKAAMEGIKDIEEQQAKKKAMADVLNQAREYKGSKDTSYSKTVPSTAGTYTVLATVPSTDTYLGTTCTAEFTISKNTISIPAPHATSIASHLTKNRTCLTAAARHP